MLRPAAAYTLIYLQAALTVAAAHGTVYTRFVSDSHVTVPELLTLRNLYWIAVPGTSFAEPDQSGLLWEYCDAFSATALLGFQSPRAETLPVLSHMRALVSFTPASGRSRD